MSWGILGPRTSDYQSLGQPGISQDVPGYPWDYLDLEQVIAKALDILGILRTTWTWGKQLQP